jgi:hypothetical protein
MWLTRENPLSSEILAWPPARTSPSTLKALMGASGYVPELLLGIQAEPRSDLILWEDAYEATGRLPFLGDQFVATFRSISTHHRCTSWHNPDIPQAFETLILRRQKPGTNGRERRRGG